MAAFFSGLLPNGTQIVTGTPNCLPAYASPSPWFPRVAATIPRRRSSAESARHERERVAHLERVRSG